MSTLIDQLKERLKDFPQVQIEDDRVTVLPAKSSITIPNALGIDHTIKIINKHIENLNNTGYNIGLVK